MMKEELTDFQSLISLFHVKQHQLFHYTLLIEACLGCDEETPIALAQFEHMHLLCTLGKVNQLDGGYYIDSVDDAREMSNIHVELSCVESVLYCTVN